MQPAILLAGFFRIENRVPRIRENYRRIPTIRDNRVPKIRENYRRIPTIRDNRVPRIIEIRSLQVHTGYLTFSLKKTALRDFPNIINVHVI